MSNTIQAAVTAAGDIDSVIALVASLEQQETPTGRSSYVVTSKGAEVKTAFKVVDASSLIISNNLDGTINPAFPEELQPRDRTRLSSKIQVNNIASSLRPAQLTDSGMSSHGAPIVGADNVVESGNGRSMGIWRAYQQDQATDYRQYLIDHASEFGLKADVIARMAMPVLVRERVTELDRAQFARDSNISDLQEMAASEKAYADAQFLTESVMALFNPSDDGNLLARSNDSFIRSFLREIGDTATAGLLTSDGRPTKQLIDRIQNAIFAKAYKDERLVRLVAEEPDPEMRNILTALNTAASDFAQMQTLSGDAHHDAVSGLVDGIESVDGLDRQAIAALQEAINLVREAKDNGQAVEEVIAQRGLFGDSSPEAEALAMFIVANNRSAKRMGAAFKSLAKRINAELTHQQQALGDMFGGGEVDLRSILTAVSGELEGEFGEGKGLDFAMFESAPGDMDPYLARLIDEATSVPELMRIIQINARVQADSHDERLLMDRFKSTFGFATATGKLDSWLVEQGYSLGALHAMLITAERSQEYRTDLNAAICEGSPAPALGAEKYIDSRITAMKAIATGQASTDWVYQRINRVAMLIPGEYSWKEVSADCVAWFMSREAIPKMMQAEVRDDLEKRLSKASDASGIIDGLQKAKAAINKRLGDISGIMAEGKAIAASAGLTKDLDSNVIADGYIEALTELKAISELVDTTDRLGLADQSTFYIGEIEKVRDKPDVLKRFLGDVFTRHGGMAMYVRQMSFMVSAAELPADKKEDLEARLVSSRSLFSDTVGYPAAITEHIHSRVKAAFDSLLATGNVSDEAAEQWSTALSLPGDISEKTSANSDSRPGYDLRKSAAQAYALAGGNISTLQEISHESKVRAYASVRSRSVVLDGDTDREHVLFHEIGHHVEFSNPHLVMRARAFIKQKAGGRLTYTNSGPRGRAEYHVKTGLSNPYMSKIYMDMSVSNTSGRVLSKAPALNNCRSTEIFSMAMQLYADPDAAAKSVLNDDGLIEFFLGCMKEIQNAD